MRAPIHASMGLRLRKQSSLEGLLALNLLSLLQHRCCKAHQGWEYLLTQLQADMLHSQGNSRADEQPDIQAPSNAGGLLRELACCMQGL